MSNMRPKMTNIASDVDILFHVGYHRTGTTFLQRVVFPRLCEYVTLCAPGGNLPDLWHFFSPRVNRGDLPYLKDFRDLHLCNSGRQEVLWQYLEQYLKDDLPSATKRILVSNENLSGPAFYCDHYHTPARIADAFPRARILICIRSHLTIIPSLFTHNYSKIGTTSYRRFVESLVENRKLFYHTFLQMYQEVFGKDSVSVVLFEELQTRPEDYFNKVLEFTGIPQSRAREITRKLIVSPSEEERDYQRIAMNRRQDLLTAKRNILINRLLLFDLIDIPTRYKIRGANTSKGRMRMFLRKMMFRVGTTCRRPLAVKGSFGTWQPRTEREAT